MTSAPNLPPKAHSSDDVHPRPKGILKNSPSFLGPPAAMTATSPPSVAPISEPEETRELTLQNTLQNAGHRRSSSTTRPGANSRRQSSAGIHDETEPRLKWDEANLYLTEQEKTAKMKIDEPKTPYAPHYDPREDEEQMRLDEAEDSLINAEGILVDELDKSKSPESVRRKRYYSEDEIPNLELGEPEENMQGTSSDPRVFRDRSMSTDSHKSEKHVHVGGDAVVDDSSTGNSRLTSAEASKHLRFKEQRKKHYEMENIKELLAHPEELDEMEDDDPAQSAQSAPPLPSMSDQFRNTGK